MKKSSGAKVIANLAKQKGISEDEIRKEIQIAIDIGMADSDPKVQEFWKNIPCKADKPTPEEAIEYMSKQAQR